MSHNWLILDVSSVAYRRFRGAGNDPGAVVPGFLADLAAYADRLAADRFAFCFDRPPGLRQAEHPFYKSNRKEEEDPGAVRRARDEMKRLRLEVLPAAGHVNLFSQPGYEGDDLVAACCAALPPDDFAFIVSADSDLDQLLAPNVARFAAHLGPRLGNVRTAQMFRNEWGIDPPRWAEVKALAGCSTDAVPGVEGVGPCYATSYLRGLPIPGPRRRAIEAFIESGVFDRNLSLVRLPYRRCRSVTLDAGTLRETPAR